MLFILKNLKRKHLTEILVIQILSHKEETSHTKFGDYLKFAKSIVIFIIYYYNR